MPQFTVTAFSRHATVRLVTHSVTCHQSQSHTVAIDNHSHSHTTKSHFCTQSQSHTVTWPQSLSHMPQSQSHTCHMPFSLHVTHSRMPQSQSTHEIFTMPHVFTVVMPHVTVTHIHMPQSQSHTVACHRLTESHDGHMPQSYRSHTVACHRTQSHTVTMPAVTSHTRSHRRTVTVHTQSHATVSTVTHTLHSHICHSHSHTQFFFHATVTVHTFSQMLNSFFTVFFHTVTCHSHSHTQVTCHRNHSHMPQSLVYHSFSHMPHVDSHTQSNATVTCSHTVTCNIVWL